MLRHIAQPLHPRRLEPYVGIEAAGDGLLDDGLLLLVQQRDQLLLGADVAANAAVNVVEVADDGELLGEGTPRSGTLLIIIDADQAVAITPLVGDMSTDPPHLWRQKGTE